MDGYLKRVKTKKQRKLAICALIFAFACINIAFLTMFTGDANEDLIIDELDAIPVSNLFIKIPDIQPL